jgi:hypothetical protein
MKPVRCLALIAVLSLLVPGVSFAVPNFAANAVACHAAIKGSDRTIINLDNMLVVNDNGFKIGRFLVYSEKGMHAFVYPTTKNSSVLVSPMNLHFSKNLVFDPETGDAFVYADPDNAELVKAEVNNQPDRVDKLLNLLMEPLLKSEAAFNFKLGALAIQNSLFSDENNFSNPGPVVLLSDASFGFFMEPDSISDVDQMVVDRARALGLIKPGSTYVDIRDKLLFENIVARALMGQLKPDELERLVQVYGFVSPSSKLKTISELQNKIKTKLKDKSPDKDKEIQRLETHINDLKDPSIMRVWNFSAPQVLKLLRDLVPRKEVVLLAASFKKGLEACSKLGFGHPLIKTSRDLARLRPVVK